MGLDMLLEARHYLLDSADKERVGTLFNNGFRAKSVVFEIKYWRKANAIHKWFVENVQEGEDDCREAYVSIEKLKELRELCNRILESTTLKKAKVENGYNFDMAGNKVSYMEDGKALKDSTLAEELLPTTEGFFFGGTDYDEWYWMNLLETRDALDELFARMEREPDKWKSISFYYSSSW